VQDPAQVAPAVAAGLGVREQPGVSAAEAVARVLARQQLLLVLDNCEHVIGAAAELCAGLLAACDDVRVLATSREPLAVAGEARCRLGPLTLPGGDDLAGAAGSDVTVRLAVALVPWWYLRGRLAGQYPLLRQVAGRATPGSDGWCAAQFWLGMAASGFADLAVALGHFTVVCDTIGDRGASRVLVDALTGRAWNLSNMGRTAEAAEVARGALAMAREVGYPGGEALA